MEDQLYANLLWCNKCNFTIAEVSFNIWNSDGKSKLNFGHHRETVLISDNFFKRNPSHLNTFNCLYEINYGKNKIIVINRTIHSPASYGISLCIFQKEYILISINVTIWILKNICLIGIYNFNLKLVIESQSEEKLKFKLFIIFLLYENSKIHFFQYYPTGKKQNKTPYKSTVSGNQFTGFSCVNTKFFIIKYQRRLQILLIYAFTFKVFICLE